MKCFVQGVGADHADLPGASRAIKNSEYELCQQNGVESVAEALLGYDGLSIALSRKGTVLDISKEELFLALAAEVPQDGKVVANPYTKWSEIDSSLPDIEIQVFGRSEEHTSELQSLMRISYAVFCLKKKKNKHNKHTIEQ